MIKLRHPYHTILSFATFAVLLFAVVDPAFAQQANLQGNQAAQQTLKLNHIKAENAKLELQRLLLPETAASVVIQVNPESNEIVLIGLAHAVQLTAQTLQSIDKTAAQPYLNTGPSAPTNVPGANHLNWVPPQHAPTQPNAGADVRFAAMQNTADNHSGSTYRSGDTYDYHEQQRFNQQNSIASNVAAIPNNGPSLDNTPTSGNVSSPGSAGNTMPSNTVPSNTMRPGGITPSVNTMQPGHVMPQNNIAPANHVASEGSEPGTYFCKPVYLNAISQELRHRYGGTPTIAIETIEQSGKILVWAPQSVHHEITSLITQANAWSEVPPGRDPREYEGTIVRFESEPVNNRPENLPVIGRTHDPKYATLDQIEVKLQTLFGDRMVNLSKEDEKQKKYRIAVPRPDKTSVCDLVFNYPGYKIEIKAPQNLAEEMARLLAYVDKPAPEDGRDRRFISIQNTNPEQMRKLLDVYRSKAVPTSSLRQRGQNMLAHHRSVNGSPNNIRQVNYTTQDDGGFGGSFGSSFGGAFDAGTGSNVDFGNGMGYDPTMGGPGGDITLITEPDSKIQVLNDLDVVIIDAPIEEVRRIMDMIKQLEELSKHAEPKIEVRPLQHVQCESLDAILRTPLRTSPITGQTVYLYTEMFVAKQGRVWVIPLHNPNAMLLIGWGQSLEAMKALIDQLDKPVEKTNSLLRVVQLEHTSAAEMATVLTDYFAPSSMAMQGFAASGFQPRIRVLSDTRTNSLIIQAAPNDYNDIERVIAALDVGEGSLKLQVNTFRMKNMLAADLVTALTGALDTAINGRPGERVPVVEMVVNTPNGRRIIESGFLTDVQITAVPGNNTVVVTAPGNCMPLISEMIEMIDQSPGTAVVKVIRIEHSDADTIQRTLQTLLPTQMTGTGGVQLPGSEGGETFIPIKFAIDTRSNSIVVAGAENDIIFIESLIKSLDKEDALQREVKTIQLHNSSATDVARALTTYLENRRDLQDLEVVSQYQRLESATIVVPDAISNVLIVSATMSHMEEIEEMVKVLDAEPPQVMVQVLIAEVTLGSADEFGIELGLQDPKLFSRSTVVSPSGTSSTLNPGFDFNDPANSIGNSASADSLATAGTVATQMLSNFATGRVNGDTGFGGLVFSASSDAVSVLIRAMQERSRVEVLSRPQIAAQDNQLAIIFVGQKVSRSRGISSTNNSSDSNVADVDVGLFLGVIPRISRGVGENQDKVVMLISASKSNLGAASDGMPLVMGGQTVRSPNINQTRIETIVKAADGETILLGGMLSTDKQEICRSVPYLSNLPILGNLFKYEYERMKRTELIVIMRPRIVRKTEDMDTIKRVEFARMNWCLADVTKLHGDIGVYNPMARQPVTGGAPSFTPAPVDLSALETIPQPQISRGNSTNTIGRSIGTPSGVNVSSDPSMGVTLQSSPLPSTMSSTMPAPAPGASF